MPADSLTVQVLSEFAMPTTLLPTAHSVQRICVRRARNTTLEQAPRTSRPTQAPEETKATRLHTHCMQFLDWTRRSS